jgi:MarR family transcriptional regulator for hemolysin
VLWQHDGLTPGEIARRLDLATPTIVNAATRMEDAGLVVRQRDSADGRLVRLYLTPQGRSVQSSIEHERSALERRATIGLTSQERRYLNSALAKIIDTLSEKTTRPPRTHSSPVEEDRPGRSEPSITSAASACDLIPMR